MMNRQTKIISFFQFQLPLIAWGVFIFTASSIPSKNIPALGEHVDKVIHFGIFGVLCWLAHVAFHHQSNFFLKRYALFVAIIFTVVFGMSDEFHQMFTPGRTADIFDLLADTVGGLVYATIYLRFRFYQNG
jgi:VanZ family protein